MPVCNSVFDRQSSADCHAELMTLPRISSGRCRVAAVGMRLDARTRSAEVLAAWAADRGIPFIGSLRETQAYVKCVEQGLTIFDLPAAQTQADRAQWQSILEWLEPVLLRTTRTVARGGETRRVIDAMAARAASAAAVPAVNGASAHGTVGTAANDAMALAAHGAIAPGANGAIARDAGRPVARDANGAVAAAVNAAAMSTSPADASPTLVEDAAPAPIVPSAGAVTSEPVIASASMLRTPSGDLQAHANGAAGAPPGAAKGAAPPRGSIFGWLPLPRFLQKHA